jgi:hypothetical protein
MTGYFHTGVIVLTVILILAAFGEIVSSITKTAKSYRPDVL